MEENMLKEVIEEARIIVAWLLQVRNIDSVDHTLSDAYQVSE